MLPELSCAAVLLAEMSLGKATYDSQSAAHGYLNNWRRSQLLEDSDQIALQRRQAERLTSAAVPRSSVEAARVIPTWGTRAMPGRTDLGAEDTFTAAPMDDLFSPLPALPGLGSPAALLALAVADTAEADPVLPFALPGISRSLGRQRGLKGPAAAAAQRRQAGRTQCAAQCC